MSQIQLQENHEEHFYSSQNSQLGKVRRALWLGALLGLVLVAASSKGSPGSLLSTAIFMLLFMGAIDWFLRRQLKTGKPSVTINHDAIESPIFTGKSKRYQWSEIVDVSVESTQGAQYLQFQLADSLGLADKRSFWTGVNYARPTIPLSSFDPEVQARLLETLNRYLQQYRGDTEGEHQALTNPLAEEQQFQEQLKSFAPVPWFTYFFVAINILVWGATLINGAGILQVPADKLLLWGGNAASEVQRGEWWRLLTATFLHSGLMHLAMNMIGLISIGITVERIYGHRSFVLIYLGSGLIGSALSLNFSAQNAVSVGASGAVFGVMGAMFMGVYQHRNQLPKTFSKQAMSSMAIFIIYSLIQGFANKGIDNAAHIGGLIGGVLLAYLLPERFDMDHFIRNLKNRVIAGIAVVLVATTSLAAMAPHAAVDQRKVFDGQAAFLRGINGFASATKALQQEYQDVQAGRLTERESDERSRTVFAPMFRNVLQDLGQAYLKPSDPRLPMLQETRRMTELFLESLEMQSVYVDGSDKPKPANPERMAAIVLELNEIGGRIQQLSKDAKARQ